ncbi:MAG: hypothetical protein R3C05_25890 [Pirellulaceae bacterium]
MRCFSPFLLSVLYGLVVCFSAGCPASKAPTPPPASDSHDDHDHEAHGHAGHDHSAPTNLAEAVRLIDHLADDIGQSFEANDPDGAHDPLHEIADALDAAGLFVGKSDLSDEQKKAAGDALATLQKSYGDVDAKMHGDEGAEYADVSSDIHSAIESLAKATSVDLGEHDHDGEADHDDKSDKPESEAAAEDSSTTESSEK